MDHPVSTVPCLVDLAIIVALILDARTRVNLDPLYLVALAALVALSFRIGWFFYRLLKEPHAASYSEIIRKL